MFHTPSRGTGVASYDDGMSLPRKCVVSAKDDFDLAPAHIVMAEFKQTCQALDFYFIRRLLSNVIV